MGKGRRWQHDVRTEKQEDDEHVTAVWEADSSVSRGESWETFHFAPRILQSFSRCNQVPWKWGTPGADLVGRVASLGEQR